MLRVCENTVKKTVIYLEEKNFKIYKLITTKSGDVQLYMNLNQRL